MEFFSWCLITLIRSKHDSPDDGGVVPNDAHSAGSLSQPRVTVPFVMFCLLAMAMIIRMWARIPHSSLLYELWLWSSPGTLLNIRYADFRGTPMGNPADVPCRSLSDPSQISSSAPLMIRVAISTPSSVGISTSSIAHCKVVSVSVMYSSRVRGSGVVGFIAVSSLVSLSWMLLLPMRYILFCLGDSVTTETLACGVGHESLSSVV